MGCRYSLASKVEAKRTNARISVHDFSVERVIGRGGFGKVNAVILRVDAGDGEDDAWYAMKKVSKVEVVDRKRSKQVWMERNVLTRLNHPHICNAYFAFQDEHCLYLVLDLALGGDLRYQLNHAKKKKPFTEMQSRFYIAQMVMALEYIHSNNILHRDIKPENILMDSLGYLKLTDFGIAQTVDRDKYCYSQSGTQGFMAPELYIGNSRHSFQADWFALGITLYEMLCKTRLKVLPHLEECLQSLKEGQSFSLLDFPKAMNHNNCLSKFSEECRDFLTSALALDSSKRLGSDRVTPPKMMSWFTTGGFEWKQLNDRTVNAPFLPDINRMNAETNADIQDIFLGDTTKNKHRQLTSEEQALFFSYDYDYRNDSSSVAKQKLASFPSTKSLVHKSERNLHADQELDMTKTSSSFTEWPVTT